MRTLAMLAAGGVLWGAAGEAPPVTVKTADVVITARLITDAETQKKLVGSELNRQYVIVELTVAPRGGYPLTISRDDFLLRSERDNERGTADSPDRIAGSAVLVVGSTGGGRPFHSESGDPIYVGGMPGTGGVPRRIGQDNTFGGGGGAGTTTASPSSAKPTPLIETLRAKELPLGEIRKPVTGHLYFPVDPKQKHKNFHLHFKGPTESGELGFK